MAVFNGSIYIRFCVPEISVSEISTEIKCFNITFNFYRLHHFLDFVPEIHRLNFSNSIAAAWALNIERIYLIKWRVFSLTKFRWENCTRKDQNLLENYSKMTSIWSAMRMLSFSSGISIKISPISMKNYMFQNHNYPDCLPKHLFRLCAPPSCIVASMLFYFLFFSILFWWQKIRNSR